MKAVLVLCLLVVAAAADGEVTSEVHALAQANGAWVVSPPELAKDLNARLAADLKLRPIDPTTKKPVTSWRCDVGIMTDVIVSWSCESGSSDGNGPLTGAGVHRAFAIRDGKLLPFDLLAALEAEDHNQTRAARRIGLSRRTLIYKMEKYGLKPPPSRADS